MTIGPAPDEIARCLLAGGGSGAGSVRVVAAVTTATAREAARRHGATPGAAAALARATTAGALLATLTKDVERVTLQVLGGGPLGGITVDSSSAGATRAFIKNPGLAIPVEPGRRVPLEAAVGIPGVLSLVRDLGLKEHFSGTTTLVDGAIDTDVEHYLIASEQIDSAVGCEALLDAGDQLVVSAGVLLQALPGSDQAPLLERMRRSLRDGLLERLLAGRGGSLTAEDLARAVVATEDEGPAALKVLEVRPLRFSCPCSRQRAAGALALIGDRDLAELVEEDGGATVVCDFCRESYRFTSDELAAARRASRSADN